MEAKPFCSGYALDQQHTYMYMYMYRYHQYVNDSIIVGQH